MERKRNGMKTSEMCNKCYLCEGRCIRIVRDIGTRIVPIRYMRNNSDCVMSVKTLKYKHLPITSNNREVNKKIRQFSIQLEGFKEKLTSSNISTQHPTMILGSVDLPSTPEASNTLVSASSISSTNNIHRLHEKINEAASKLARIQTKLELAENLKRNSAAFPSNHSSTNRVL